MRNNFLFPAFLLSLTSFLLSGCATPRLAVDLLDHPVTIDGDLGEWQSSLQEFPEQKVWISASDDGEFLYLALRVWDRGYVRPISKDGLVVWLDPTGKKNKDLGVMFPVGRRGAPDSVDLLDAAGHVTRTTTEALSVYGFAAQYSSTQDDTLDYELKIPIKPQDGNPCYVVPGSQRIIGLGLEVPEAGQGKSDKWEKQPGGSREAGGIDEDARAASEGGMRHHGGMGGRGGGREKGGEGEGGDEDAHYLKAWFQLRLAPPGPSN